MPVPRRIDSDDIEWQLNADGTVSMVAPADVTTPLSGVSGGGADLAAANVFTANQTVKNDAVDTWPGGGLNLTNKTDLAAQQVAGRNGSASAFLKPGIHWATQDTAGVFTSRWQSPAMDVGPGSYGTFPGDLRHDIVLAFHLWPADTTKNADIIYLTDEATPRVGVLKNVPSAQLHVGNREAGRATLALAQDLAGQNTHLLRYEHLGVTKGGIWANGSTMKLGLGQPTEPNEIIDLFGGKAKVGAVRLARGYFTDYVLESNDPLMYSTASGGSGVYPFDGSANAVIQGGQVTGSTTKDIVFALGRDSLTPALVLHGGSAALKNVSVNPDAANPLNLLGGGAGVIGVRTVGTAPSSAPAGGIALWAQNRALYARGDIGVAAMGGLHPVSAAGGFGAGATANTIDARIYRAAAKVWGIGVAGVTAPTMDGAGVILENVTAAPSTNPVGGGVLYCESGALKYRGTGGTITTIGPA